MATESRTGFRLPWSLETRSAAGVEDEQVAREPASTEPAEPTAMPALYAIEGGAVSPEEASAAPGAATPQAPDDTESAFDRHPDDGAEAAGMNRTGTIEIDAAQTGRAEAPAGEPAEPAESPSEPAAESPEAYQAPQPASERPRPAGDHRPNRLQAELTNAMRAAAEAAREATLSQYRADGKAFVERVQAEATEHVGDYRRQADSDIAGIRDWGKSEAARIREETDRRIADRKARLETELEDHAARIAREVDRVQARISSFEDEMSRFFEELLREEDPSRFGAIAANLPEPPAFEAVLAEAEAAEADVVAAVDAPEAETEPAVEPEAAVDIAEESTEALGGAVGQVEHPVDVEGTADAAEQADADVEATPAMGDVATDEGMHEAIGTVEKAESDVPAADASPELTASSEAEDAQDHKAVDVDAEPVGSFASTDSHEAETPEQPIGSFGSTHDPRLAALGLTPDFAAAEAEAYEDATIQEDDGSSDADIPLIEDNALASRLSHLVPPHEDARPWPTSRSESATRTTQVVVVGLVSVASIASFKRHLSRVSGVQSVGVSSGPDGEFVFAVAHADSVDLREVVPGLPGFKARVSSAGDGIVNVTAHDPESD